MELPKHFSGYLNNWINFKNINRSTLNLLLVDAVDFPFGGAHSVHISLLMKGMRENGANASFIIPYGRKRESASANKRKYGHVDGIPYCFVRYSKALKKGFRFLDIFIGVVQTAALIYRRKKKQKLDAVILGGIVDIIRDSPIILVCSICRIPLYFWLVEKASLSEDYRGIAGYLNCKSQKLTERFLPTFASGVIVISESLKKHYVKYLTENKILISPILVSDDTHRSIDNESLETTRRKIKQSLDGRRLLVYSGSFGEKDGIYYLIDAFAEVSTEYPDAIFVMTGKHANNAVMEAIRNYIKQKNLQDNIWLVGFVNADELLSYYTLADVLLACRSNSPFANHGFPWKLGEFCMTGKPIIATRVSDIDKYFVDNENLFVVEPNNPVAIANRVKFIFGNYIHALTVALRGKETAIKEFGYCAKGNELVRFIEENNLN